MASSALSRRWTVTTGPKTSFCTISSCCTDAGHDGRLHEEPAVAAGRAAGQHLGAGARRAVQEAEHALLLGGRDDRAHLDRLAVGRVADDQRGRGGDELLQQRVVDAGRGEHARGGGAVLARVQEARDPQAGRDLRRVGVVEHDRRRLAAELEVHALERCRPRRARSTCRSPRCRSATPSRRRDG